MEPYFGQIKVNENQQSLNLSAVSSFKTAICKQQLEFSVKTKGWNEVRKKAKIRNRNHQAPHLAHRAQRVLG